MFIDARTRPRIASGVATECEVADVAFRPRRAANENSSVGDKADFVIGRRFEKVASPIAVLEVERPSVTIRGPSARSRKRLAGRQHAGDEVRAVDLIVSRHRAVANAATAEPGRKITRRDRRRNRLAREGGCRGQNRKNDLSHSFPDFQPPSRSPEPPSFAKGAMTNYRITS